MENKILFKMNNFLKGKFSPISQIFLRTILSKITNFFKEKQNSLKMTDFFKKKIKNSSKTMFLENKIPYKMIDFFGKILSNIADSF